MGTTIFKKERLKVKRFYGGLGVEVQYAFISSGVAVLSKRYLKDLIEVLERELRGDVRKNL